MRIRIVPAVLLAVLVPLLAACADDGPETAVEAFDEGGEDLVELVTGEPFEATGEVDDVLSPYGFRLYDTLVVTPDGTDVPVEDADVRVVGEVQEAGDVEQEHGDQLGDEVLDALADEDVVVVASLVERVDVAG